MSHEMAGAGYGFLWPLVTFESDGEEVSAVCRPSNPLSYEPVRYLADIRETISASSFEKMLDGFVNLVLARLEALGIHGTHLQDLWSEVREERADPALARSRKLEARLGFEPDEAPENLMQRMSALAHKAGHLRSMSLPRFAPALNLWRRSNRLSSFPRCRARKLESLFRAH
jgi:hypothetical protein